MRTQNYCHGRSRLPSFSAKGNTTTHQRSRITCIKSSHTRTMCVNTILFRFITVLSFLATVRTNFIKIHEIAETFYRSCISFALSFSFYHINHYSFHSCNVLSEQSLSTDRNVCSSVNILYIDSLLLSYTGLSMT